MKEKDKGDLLAFLLSLSPEDAYEESRVGMSAEERLYEQLFCREETTLK